MPQPSPSVEEALEAYKTRMKESNRAFFSAKISALEQDPTLSDRQRLDALAPCFHEGKWFRSGGHGSNITSPAQLLIPPGKPGYVDLGLDRDGTIPPAPETAVNTFLDSLTNALNQASPGQTLVVPDDYRRLLKLTDAISDIDFAQKGKPGLDGVCGGIPPRHHFSDRLHAQNEWRATGWTVLGGWLSAFGGHGGVGANVGSTELLYSKKDDGSPDEQLLKWRVYEFNSDDMDGRWFSCIADWLEYKSNWLDRLPDGWQSARMEPPEDYCGTEDEDEDDDAGDDDPDDDDAEEDDTEDHEEAEDDSEKEASAGLANASGTILSEPSHHSSNRSSTTMTPTAEVNEPLSTLTLDDRVRKAVKTFEDRQAESNQQWLEAQIKTCEATADATALQNSLGDLVKSFKFHSWAQMSSELHINTPRELLSLDRNIGQHDRGTSSPVSSEERDAFLQRLTAGINQVYDSDEPDFRVVPLPEDYKLLLSITDGLKDNDLRGSGVCGVDGIRIADISTMAPDETEKLPLGNGGWRLGWDLSTGFLLGRGNPPHTQWLVYYYCSRSENTPRGPKRGKDPVKDSEREWKWRLFYKEPERSQHSFMHPMVFDGLVEWLKFYQEWWTRETKDYPEWHERMKRNVELLYGPDPKEKKSKSRKSRG